MTEQRTWCAIQPVVEHGARRPVALAWRMEDEGGICVTAIDMALVLRDRAEEGCTFVAWRADIVLAQVFPQLGLSMRAVAYGGRFNHGSWKYHSRQPAAQLWDVRHLAGDLSLDDLARSMDLELYSVPQKLLGLETFRYEWECTKHQEWECYECWSAQVAEIGYRYLESLSSTLSAWGVPVSRRLPATAAHVWRALDHPQPCRITDRTALYMARNAYIGARIEAYRLGTIPGVWEADIRSSYGAVMANTPYPDPDHLVTVENPKLDSWLYTYEGVAEATVSVPPSRVPPLPYRHRGELYFPVGTVRGTWTLLELRYALSLGCEIASLGRVCYSTVSLHPFTNFVAVLWELRQAYQAKGDPRQVLAKLLIDHLYGYLGMRGYTVRSDVWPQEAGKRIDMSRVTGWYDLQRRLWLTYERTQPCQSTWTNTMWAAQTTAGGRIALHHQLLKHERGLVQCHTDGLLITHPPAGLETGIGGLRETATYRSVIVAGPGLLAYEGNDGTWRGKGNGLKPEAALTLLRQGVVTINEPVTLHGQRRTGQSAGTWIAVSRELEYAPGKRQPTHPENLRYPGGFSDTAPVWFGLE